MRESDGIVKLPLQFFLRQGFGEIGRDPNFSLIEPEEPDRFIVPSGAEDEAERGAFAVSQLVFLEPCEIKLHLALVRRQEMAELEVDRHKAFKTAVVKQEVEVVIYPADRHTLLPSDKGESDAEFQDESFHFTQDGGFKVLLGIAIFKPEKIEDVRIAKNQVGREAILFAECRQLMPGEFFGLFREGGAQKKLRVDLGPQRPERSSAPPGTSQCKTRA